MAAAVRNVAVVEARIVGIAQPYAEFPGKVGGTRAAISKGIRQVPGICIAPLELKSAGALVDRDCASLVVAKALTHPSQNIRHLRERNGGLRSGIGVP